MNYYLPLGILISMVVVTSCAPVKITSEKPASQTREVIGVTPEKIISTVNIPVSFSVKRIEEKLNKELGEVLYEDDKIKGGLITIKVKRTGNIKAEADDNAIFYTLPVHVYVKATWKWEPCSICPEIEKSESTEFELKVKGKTDLSLKEDLSLNTSTNIDYEWSKKPNIEMGPFKIGIAGLVEPVLNKQMNDLGKILDDEIQKKINLKSMLQQAWLKIQEPMLIDADYNTWLLLSPTEIRATPLVVKANNISLTAGIKTYVSTVSGDMPPTVPNKNLPQLILDKNIKDNFSLNLISEITYLQAEKIIKNQFTKDEMIFENGKYKLKIDSVNIYGSEDKMAIRLEVKGSAKTWLFRKKIKGEIFLQGTPYYDAATGMVKIKDFDFNLKSKDVLLKSAGWVTKIGFKEKLNQMLQFPLKQQLDDARKKAQNALDKNGKINEMLSIRCNLKNAEPTGVYITPSSMKVYYKVDGKMSLQIDKF